MTTPPQALWESTGNHESGSTANIEVRICRDTEGRVWSLHMPQTPEDEQVFAQWPANGTAIIAHAMLTEALRREAYMCILAALTKDPNIIDQYKNSPAEKQAEIAKDLEQGITQSLGTVLPRMIPDIAKEILAMASKQGSNGVQSA